VVLVKKKQEKLVDGANKLVKIGDFLGRRISALIREKVKANITSLCLADLFHRAASDPSKPPSYC
jgi:hypothetical protein